MSDPLSLERLVPDEIAADEHTGVETLEMHLERYRFAAGRARPGRLLDSACGVGYGTRLLTDEAAQVERGLGLDIDASAIDYARSRYANERTEYACLDLLESDLSAVAGERGFDTIVSLETIEHLPEPELFLARLVTLLAPGGVLIASVPTTPSVDLNPHHLHDFTRRSFRGMLARHGLEEFDHLIQIQNVSPIAVARRTEQRMSQMRRGLVGWYARHPGAFARRIGATLRHGFTNHYLTLACRRSSDGVRS